MIFIYKFIQCLFMLFATKSQHTKKKKRKMRRRRNQQNHNNNKQTKYQNFWGTNQIYE